VFDDACTFVTEEERKALCPARLHRMEVAVADARRLDPDDHLVVSGLVEDDLLDAVASHFGQNDSAVHV
jgi:hypothetical protein